MTSDQMKSQQEELRNQLIGLPTSEITKQWRSTVDQLTKERDDLRAKVECLKTEKAYWKETSEVNKSKSEQAEAKVKVLVEAVEQIRKHECDCDVASKIAKQALAETATEEGK